jgi:hypothetical protein
LRGAATGHCDRRTTSSRRATVAAGTRAAAVRQSLTYGPTVRVGLRHDRADSSPGASGGVDTAWPQGLAKLVTHYCCVMEVLRKLPGNLSQTSVLFFFTLGSFSTHGQDSFMTSSLIFLSPAHIATARFGPASRFMQTAPVFVPKKKNRSLQPLSESVCLKSKKKPRIQL